MPLLKSFGRRRAGVLLLSALASGLWLTAPGASAVYAAGGGHDGSSLPSWLLGKQQQYFQFSPFNLPVIRDGRPVRHVSLTVTVETEGLDNKNRIIEKRHKLQSAFLRDLHGVVSIRQDKDRPVDLTTVKTRLRAVADRVMGPGIVKDVLIEHAYTRQVY